METQSVMYLNNNWLGDNETAGALTVGGTTDACNYQWWVTPTYTWPSYYYTQHPRIRLTLTEVEHLRKLCRSDRRLRETMEKVAPYIDVEVDFPGQ